MSNLGRFLKSNFILYKDVAIANANSLSLLKKFPSNSIDCVITDPPYFIDGMGNNWNVKDLNNKTKKGKVISNLPIGMKFDPQQGKDFQHFEESLSKLIFNCLKPGGFYLSFSQPRLYHRMTVAIEDCGFEIRDMIVWKRNGQAKAFSLEHFTKDINTDVKELLKNKKTPQLRGLHEDIVVAQKPKEGTFIENFCKYKVGLINSSYPFPSNLINIEKDRKEKVKHLTTKPIKLVQYLLDVFTDKRNIVLDPFLGSGTTVIACRKMNRRCIGIELNELYFNLIKSRIITYEKESSFLGVS